MEFRIIYTAYMGRGEYYTTDMLITKKAVLVMGERRGYGVGAIVVQEPERETDFEDARGFIRAIFNGVTKRHYIGTELTNNRLTITVDDCSGDVWD